MNTANTRAARIMMMLPASGSYTHVPQTEVGHLLGKLAVENRVQAIVQALKRGSVSLDDLE
jgi:uncharacterized membrane protein YjjB (DUF3815 family)